jgi:hypothetical protein
MSVYAVPSNAPVQTWDEFLISRNSHYQDVIVSADEAASVGNQSSLIF